MLLATSVGQRAYESQAKKQGYFTAALIEALKGRAAGGGREVTLDRLVRLCRRMPQAEWRDLAPSQSSVRCLIEGYQSDQVTLAVSESGATPAKPDG